MMHFDEVLRTFIAYFERESVEYALAGGLAIVAWGHTRLTHDVDFVVNGRDSDRVIAFAESAGYRTMHVSSGYSNHRHPDEAFGNIDFMYVYGETARQVFAGVTRLTVADTEVAVTRPEHLVAMKVNAMSSSPMRVLIDAPDIAFLLSLPDIDREKAREYFARHGLLKIYDELERERG
ncbi:MAG: hypothetical protein QOJ98_37 [Acidobacteriota bacterium]|jgi:hypothetical protein|nr:hypothetical protein [Acidobacteriota bacterium]